MSEQDLRNFERRTRDYRVEYSILSGAGVLDVLPARTLDLSVSGARIEIGRELKKGDRLSVRFEVPDLQSFTQDQKGCRRYKTTVLMCFGEVRWVSRAGSEQGYTAGVRFSNLSSVERINLKVLLAEELEDSGILDGQEE